MDTSPTSPSATPAAGQPKQYIRTFHGDLETVKKGGTPDLVPLGAPTLPAAPPTITPPLPAPTAQMPRPVPQGGFGAQPIPSPAAPIPAAIPTTPEVPIPLAGTGSFSTVGASVPKTMPLETYAGDFTERMKETQASTATVLAAEQDKAPTLVQSQPKKYSLSGILYTVGGTVLVIAGGIGAYLAYTRYLSGAVPVMLTPAATAPIFVDDREEISGTGIPLLQEIEQSATRPLAQGSIRLLYLASATTTTSVFSALQLPAPGALLRNINNAQSMAGIAEVGGAESPFFILSVTSFGDTFAAMLQWEQRMPRDLAKLFPAYSAPIPNTPTAPLATSTGATTTVRTVVPIATTTPAPIPPPATAGFFDATVANHDVRVYRDASGRDILLYGYWNRTTLIIAHDAAAFTEIVGRLATSRTP